MAAWSFMTRSARAEAIRKARDAGISAVSFAKQYGCTVYAATSLAQTLGVPFEGGELFRAPIEVIDAIETINGDGSEREPSLAYREPIEHLHGLREGFGAGGNHGLARNVASAIAGLAAREAALVAERDTHKAAADTAAADLALLRAELARLGPRIVELEHALKQKDVEIAALSGWLSVTDGAAAARTDVLDCLAPEDAERLRAMAARTEESPGLVGAKLLAAVLLDDAVANGEAEAADAPMSPPAAADIVAALSGEARASLFAEASREGVLPTQLAVTLVEAVALGQLYDAVLE